MFKVEQAAQRVRMKPRKAVPTINNINKIKLANSHNHIAEITPKAGSTTSNQQEVSVINTCESLGTETLFEIY